MFLVHFDIWLAVTIFNYVCNKIVDNLCIVNTDCTILKITIINNISFFCILTVFAEIGNNVRDSHYTALKSSRHKLSHIPFVYVASFNLLVKFFKAFKWFWVVFAQLHFAVVCCNSVKSL